MKFGDFGMTVSAFDPLHFEVEIEQAYREVGKIVARRLRDGDILAAQVIEVRDRDLLGRCLVCSLHLKLRPVPEVDHNVAMLAPVMRVEPWPKPPARKNVLQRLGRFIAETWEEAGETVRQCKAA